MTIAKLSSETDEDLFLLYRAGDRAAFELFYRRWSPRLMGWLTNNVDAAELRDDLLQMIWIKIHSARERYRRSEPIGPWIFVIARHCVFDARRRAMVRPEGHLAADNAVLEDLPQAEADGDVSFNLSSLTTEQRELLRLRFEEDLSFEALSKRTGVSATTLRQRISRIVRKLRNEL